MPTAARRLADHGGVSHTPEAQPISGEKLASSDAERDRLPIQSLSEKFSCSFSGFIEEK